MTQLARAIKQSGRVILCGNLNLLGDTSARVFQYDSIRLRIKASPIVKNILTGLFAPERLAWGNANLKIDPDYGIRSFYPAFNGTPGSFRFRGCPAQWRNLPARPKVRFALMPTESRWLNYYGPPRSIPSVSYFLAVLPGGVPPGFFKDKIVFVGAQLSADFSGKGKDEFLTPYAYWGKGFAPGVEIHATAALESPPPRLAQSSAADARTVGRVAVCPAGGLRAGSRSGRSLRC